MVKNSLYKTIGKTSLSFDEFEDVILDVEQTLNNRPLSYVEDDIQFPVLTPNNLIYGEPNFIPSVEDHYLIEKGDLRKRFQYVKKCKDDAWNRWTREYVKGLREKHDLNHKQCKMPIVPKAGDVVIVRGDEKNRGKWKLAIITSLFPGTDGIIRAVELRTKNVMLQRPVQLLYPLELSCDDEKHLKTEPNINVETMSESRPKRNAAEIALLKIKDQLNS